MNRCILIIIVLTGAALSLPAQQKLSQNIRLNQVGFYPGAEKIAVVEGGTYSDFFITTPGGKAVLFRGKLGAARTSPFSSKQTRHADFSAFRQPGTYVVVVPGAGQSFTFDIGNHVHSAVAKASLKAFYYQRFSIDLGPLYAGPWQRVSGPGHRDIIVHASAATPARPAGTVIPCPRGWMDAGDYNKYIVNSGITMGTLLSAYEDFATYYDTLDLNIPESGDGVPDLLDEVLWNLRWMLTMQDPSDGGVYHKCTNASFDGMVMPAQAVTPRYVVQKGTAATLNFAAVMAQACRVLRPFEKIFPDLADSCLSAATTAWRWAQQNPAQVYDQASLNAAFDPDISTGAYGDKSFSDEFIWAAAELFATTKDARYLTSVDVLPDENMPLPSWNQVRLLGYYTLLRLETQLPLSIAPTMATLKTRLLKCADAMIKDVATHPYRTVMGSTAKDFVWGSNAVAANQGILLIQAYRISHNKRYLDHALGNLDYLLGRNATGYSFVTGYGDKTPKHPHHRPSEADGVLAPVPGLLAGGPNPGMQDKCHYPSAIPDEAYIDDVCSYASNEVAINWNAPLVYLAGAMEALQLQYDKP